MTAMVIRICRKYSVQSGHPERWTSNGSRSDRASGAFEVVGDQLDHVLASEPATPERLHDLVSRELGFEGVADPAPGPVKQHPLMAIGDLEDVARFACGHPSTSRRVTTARLRSGQVVDGLAYRLGHALCVHSVLDVVHPRSGRA